MVKVRGRHVVVQAGQHPKSRYGKADGSQRQSRWLQFDVHMLLSR